MQGRGGAGLGRGAGPLLNCARTPERLVVVRVVNSSAVVGWMPTWMVPSRERSRRRWRCWRCWRCWR